MIIRLLPREEWFKLAGTEIADALPYVPPDTRVIVVEQGSEIVGCWGLPRYLHCECLWIHPDHRRRGVVGRYLYDRMQHEAAQSGDCVVLTAALSEDVATLIRKVGGQALPGTHFVMPIGVV